MKNFLLLLSLSVFTFSKAQTGLFSNDHSGSDSLFIIDHLAGGAITGLVDNEGEDWMALACDISNQKIYAFSACVGSRSLFSFDLATSTVFTIASLNGISIFGADFDNTNQILYAVGMVEGSSNGVQTLYRYNLTTGQPTAIGDLNLPGSDGFCSAAGEGINGLAYDSALQTLWGFSSNKLYNINTTTGAATLVGPVAPGGIRGGAYDIANSTLWAISQQEDLYQIDPTTGNVLASLPSTGSFGNITGLAYITTNCAQPSAPLISNVLAPTCALNTGSFSVSSPVGVGYEYSIGGSFQSNPSFSGIAPGNYNVTVRLGACVSAATIQVIPSVTNNVTSPILDNLIQPGCTPTVGSFSIASPLGANYQYSIGGVYQASPNFSNLIAGNYNVTVKDLATMCISPITFQQINANTVVPQTPVLTFVTPNCNSTGAIKVNEPLSPELNFLIDGAGAQSNNVFYNLIPGTYQISVVNTLNGCISVQTTQILSAFSETTIFVTGPTSIDEGASAVLMATGAQTYEWFSSNDSIAATGDTLLINPTQDLQYCAIGTDTAGCVDTACIYVALIPACDASFIPSIFSPNSDEVNDGFGVFIKSSCIKEPTFTIFNRWGEIVFETSDVKQLWDGKFKGKDLPSGTYFYKFAYTSVSSENKKTVKSGNFTLVR
jgi:gliding motility-associated-like protein